MTPTGGGDLLEITGDYGKVNSIYGAIISIIIALLLLIIGWIKLEDKHTSQTMVTVVKVLSTKPTAAKNGQTTYTTESSFVYTVEGTRYQLTKTYTFPNQLKAGDVFSIQYNPSTPTDVSYEFSPKRVALILMGAGLMIGTAGVALSYLTFHSKTFATAAGVSGILARV